MLPFVFFFCSKLTSYLNLFQGDLGLVTKAAAPSPALDEGALCVCVCVCVCVCCARCMCNSSKILSHHRFGASA